MSLSSSCATRRCVPGNAERPIESLSVASQMWVFWSSGFTPVQSIPRTQASTGHVPEYCFLFPQPLAPTPSPLTPSLSLSLPLSLSPSPPLPLPVACVCACPVSFLLSFCPSFPRPAAGVCGFACCCAYVYSGAPGVGRVTGSQKQIAAGTRQRLVGLGQCDACKQAGWCMHERDDARMNWLRCGVT